MTVTRSIVAPPREFNAAAYRRLRPTDAPVQPIPVLKTARPSYASAYALDAMQGAEPVDCEYEH